MKVFSGYGRGLNESAVRADDLRDLLSDFLDTYLYAAHERGPNAKIRHSFLARDNDELWKHLLGFQFSGALASAGLHTAWSMSRPEGLEVALEGFIVTEWVPLSPGRFFTSKAEEHRERAKANYDPELREYLSLGKEEMVLGGVGSLRLTNKLLEGERYAIIGATSSGVSHEGIPILIPETEAVSLKERLVETGGAVCNLTGTIRYLPKSLSVFHYDGDLPRVAINVKDLCVFDRTPPRILVTIATAFAAPAFDAGWEFLSPAGATSLQKGWCFASFSPSNTGYSLVDAIDWMKDFAFRRYGRNRVPPVLFDFDQVLDHFPAQVEFSVRDLFDRKLDFNLLQFYAQGLSAPVGGLRAPISVNIHGNLIMGDHFENISEAYIINRSQVADADLPKFSGRWEVAELVQRTGSAVIAKQYEQLIDQIRAGRLILSHWWGFAKQLKMDDEVLRRFMGELVARKLGLAYYSPISATLLSAFNALFESEMLDSPTFEDYLRVRTYGDLKSRILAWSKLTGSCNPAFSDPSLRESVSREVLDIPESADQADYVDGSSLANLGALTYSSSKKGAVLLFETVLEELRSGHYEKIQSKIANIVDILALDKSMRGDLRILGLLRNS